MENPVVQLLSRAFNVPQDDSFYSDIKDFIENPDSIFELINIAESQDIPFNIQVLSIILIKQIIYINFPSFNEQNYLFLLQVSEQIERKLTQIFYSPKNKLILVSQFALLCCFLMHRLNFFYSIGTSEFEIQDLQLPSFYLNITEILIEIIQNEELFQNSFTIALEFLLYCEENRIENFIDMEFCRFIYPFLFESTFSSNSIQILNLMKDYSIIPTIFENINQIEQKESFLQFIKLLNSFYLSIINSPELADSDGFRLFDLSFEFLLKCINENDEDEMNSVSFEAVTFFYNLMSSFSKNLFVLFDSRLNELVQILFEKVGIDQNIEFFGISRIALKTIQIISIIFPFEETLDIIFPKIESILSNPSESDRFEILCSLRTFSKILSIKNRKLIFYSPLLEIIKLAIESSMHFIQFIEFASDSASLFTRSLKIIFLIQNFQNIQQLQGIQQIQILPNFQEFQEFDINLLVIEGLKQLIQAYSVYELEIKKKLANSIFSLLNFCQIPLHIFLTDIIQIFVNSTSPHEYSQNSYFLGKFIEKSVYLNEEVDLESEFQELIQFVMNSMSDDSNLFFLSSIHIIGSSIVKCPELTPFIVSSLCPKIIEFLTSFESSDFYQYEKMMNYENVSTFSWIIQFLININKASFIMNYDSIQLFDPILPQISLFLDPLLPKSVNRATWMLLNSLVDTTLKSLHKEQIDEEQSGGLLKFINDLAQIVKNSVLQLFSYLVDDDGLGINNNDEDGFAMLFVAILGIIGQTTFSILREFNFNSFSSSEEENENEEEVASRFLFSPVDEIKMAAFVLIQLFNLQREAGVQNTGAAIAVTCCFCLLVQCPGGAEQIFEMVDADLMGQLIQSFSLIKDDEIKQMIAPGIRLILLYNSIGQ